MKRIKNSAAGLFVLTLILFTGCGHREVDTQIIDNLLEDSSILIQKYIDGMQRARSLEGVTGQMETFLAGIKRLTPDLNENLELARMSAGSLKTDKEAAVLRLLAVIRLEEKISRMDLKRFGEHSRINELREKLVTAFEAINFKDIAINSEKADQAFTDLMEGRIQGNSALAALSQKMGRASVSSKLKITMRILADLGAAVNRYIKDYGFAPQIKSVEDLHLYEKYKLYFKELAIKDAWGNLLLYQNDGARFWLASSGSDGKFKGFDQQGTFTRLAGNDLIFSNNRFSFWPDFRGR